MNKGKYVYVMEKRDGSHKIGISKDPTRRANEIRLASGQPVKVIYKRYAENAKKVESLLHILYVSNRREGEFFKGLDIPELFIAINELIDNGIEQVKIEEEKITRMHMTNIDTYKYDLENDINPSFYFDKLFDRMEYGGALLGEASYPNYESARNDALTYLDTKIQKSTIARLKLEQCITFEEYCNE